MKIDTSQISLSAKRKFFQEKEITIERETRFSTLFDTRVRQRAMQERLHPGGGPDDNIWFSKTDINGTSAVQLTQQFMAELEKIRTILEMIFEHLNSGGLNNCCMDMTGFGLINIFSGIGLSGNLYEMEVTETTRVSYREEESTSFFADGKVTTADGRKIDLSYQMNLDHRYFRKDQFVHKEKGYVLIDPLVINLDTTIPRISDIRIDFDLNADGKNENIQILEKGSGFLSLDKNGDGIINDGSELFGPSTGNGFMELSEYDNDRNLWIDENDPIYDELTIWAGDEEGQMQLTRLKDAGIGAIYLPNVSTSFGLKDEENDLEARIKNSSVALNEDGSVSSIQEMDWTV